jgi:hypothetical protein
MNIYRSEPDQLTRAFYIDRNLKITHLYARSDSVDTGHRCYPLK